LNKKYSRMSGLVWPISW